MTALQDQLGNQCETTARYRQAGEAHDIEGLLATLAPDVVFRSPITDRIEFRGHDELRELLGSVFTVLHDIHFFADIGDQRTRALFHRAIVNSQPVEEATRLELNEQGQIREITLFFRPLPGLATFAAAVAPHVARKHGPIRSIVVRILIFPLGLATRVGDRLVPWFA